MGTIRTNDDDRCSRTDRGAQLVITEVVAETFGNAVQVELSPQELTVTERRQLRRRRPAKNVRVCNSACMLYITVVDFTAGVFRNLKREVPGGTFQVFIFKSVLNLA